MGQSEEAVLSKVSEVVMGQVYTAGGGQNPARQAAKAAGKLTHFCLPHLRGHRHQKTQLLFMTRFVHFDLQITWQRNTVYRTVIVSYQTRSWKQF